MRIEEAAAEFLALRRIAVAGASAGKQPGVGNGIADRLRNTGHEVFLVHPRAERIGDVECHPTVDAIPGGVEGVVVATSAHNARVVAEQAARAGARWIWFHQGTGPVSFDDEALETARSAGLKTIAVGCPMMYCEPDIAHRCMRGLFRASGRIPRSIDVPART